MELFRNLVVKLPWKHLEMYDSSYNPMNLVSEAVSWFTDFSDQNLSKKKDEPQTWIVFFSLWELFHTDI